MFSPYLGKIPNFDDHVFFKGVGSTTKQIEHVAARVHLRPMILVEGCHPNIAMISGPEKVESCYFD